MKRRFRPISEGSGKTILILALVFLSTLPVAGLYAHHRALGAVPKGAHIQPQEIKRRAVAIGTMLGMGKPIVGEPEYIAQWVVRPGLRGLRRLWTVECLAGAHHYNLVFNDVTGNMESMYADGLTVSSKAAAQTALIVNTPGQAVEGAVQCLKNLQIVSRGSRIALAQSPECDRDGVTWRMVWKVQHPEAAQPYEVRVLLNGSDASPMMVVNCSELDRYARN